MEKTTSPSKPDERSTIAEGKDWLRDHLDEGTNCPVCTQFAKTYQRKINSRQAYALITLYRVVGRGWGHLPTIDDTFRGDGGMIALLRYWGLVIELPERREDGGRAGWWQVTEKGEDWIRRRVKVPKYARIYNARCLGLVGDPVGIEDALGTRFRYDELMEGV